MTTRSPVLAIAMCLASLAAAIAAGCALGAHLYDTLHGGRS